MVKFSMDENGMLTFLAGDPAPHVRIFALSWSGTFKQHRLATSNSDRHADAHGTRSIERLTNEESLSDACSGGHSLKLITPRNNDFPRPLENLNNGRFPVNCSERPRWMQNSSLSGLRRKCWAILLDEIGGAKSNGPSDFGCSTEPEGLWSVI
jgi:hypothetical protein